MNIKGWLAALATVIGMTSALPACAQGASGRDYPNRPIRLIMPNQPGSANDTLTRIISVKLGEVLGQQIVIDNRAGAGGILGMEIGKGSNPDGYTLLCASTAAMSIAPHVYQKLPYDPLKDFEYLSMFGVTPNLLVVNPGMPVRSMKEFVDWQKARGTAINMASAGTGAQSHLTGSALMVAAGFQTTHVPYKGGGASVAAVVANESQWTITPTPAVMGLVRSGRLRPIAHSLPERTPLLPDLPSIGETVKGFKYSGWNGLLAPKGTPRVVINRIREALVKVSQMQDLKDQFANQGAIVQTSTAEEFRQLVADEIREIGPVVKAAGLKVE
jgi:tripartite-type tricarboxylate transporter receptor subunit TctC